MTIDPFGRDDIARFLKLAALENWLAESWEFEFLLSNFSQGCFAAIGESGIATGFVTSLLHDRSGWIGNLIVAEQFRGRGIGAGLFRKAMEALQIAGAETIWLTASKSGQRLYAKCGFRSIDSIIRWSGKGQQRHTWHYLQANTNFSISLMASIDCQAWGDRRDALLSTTINRGRVLQDGSGFAVIQKCSDALQLGPFSVLVSSAADHIFNTAIGSVPFDTKIYIDTPALNRSAQRLLKRRGMQICGSNELMYAGKKPDYHPQLIYGLATMGSCG